MLQQKYSRLSPSVPFEMRASTAQPTARRKITFLGDMHTRARVRIGLIGMVKVTESPRLYSSQLPKSFIIRLLYE